MAQKVTVELVDDLDGTTSDDISTAAFGVDGVHDEIDLTDDNATRLRVSLGDYIAAARRTGGRLKRGTASGTTSAASPTDREQTKAIREWARQNGYDLADCGRIPDHVLVAFAQAQTETSKTKKRRRKTTEPAVSH
ncbi:MAG TPA: Lsr2 family protein [Actinophytocola sp.]|uniref:histone-like nucleoid-structuring protein Lsr2 n=1 Tax=Actinophytocola sp. TaxID=1872138 RepID=UPI002DDD2893|nr:Lsr2 family protein [Actinophytocola sp.]HEV2778719.1 Lsr2 family protein [Actinophytocola sp.]